eukprot:6487594-Amphidinium_carterae.8
MPPEWEDMTDRALSYFRARNIPSQNGMYLWHNLEWGTSPTGMARWHASSTDANKDFMLNAFKAMYNFLMVSTGVNLESLNRMKEMKSSDEYQAAYNKYVAKVRQEHEQEKAMGSARRSGSMEPKELFTPKEYNLYLQYKKDVAEFTWHLR